MRRTTRRCTRSSGSHSSSSSHFGSCCARADESPRTGGGPRTIRGPRYKYSVWNEGENREMLIDMQKDPGEMRNLAADPAAAGILAKHRQRLDQVT